MSRFASSVAEGKSAEERFVADYILTYGLPETILKASQYQNIHEHWDVSINGDCIDVKGRRRLSRGSGFNEAYAIFEMKNVSGRLGWGYGLATFIVYEFEDRWVTVDRDKIVSIVEPKLLEDKQVYYKFAGPYKNHSREGRNDLFTWIPVADLEEIKTSSFIKKIKDAF